MMLTFALFALFAIALGTSVLSLADTIMRGRNAYAEMKNATTAWQGADICGNVSPAARVARQPMPQLKFAA